MGLLSDYLTHLSAKGRAPATINAYDVDLRDFQATPAGYRRYLASLDGYKPASRRRKIVAARSYCRWLGVTGWEVVLACRAVPAESPRVLTDDEAARLLKAILGSTPLALRDRAMLHLLLGVGCRASEMVALDVDHVLPTRSVVVAAGTDREREVPLESDAAYYLAAYASHGRHHLKPRDAALFVNHRGERLSRQGLWLIVQDHASRAGLGRVSPSVIRHTAARRLVAFATDPYDAKYLLGHANISTTLLYRQAA